MVSISSLFTYRGMKLPAKMVFENMKTLYTNAGMSYPGRKALGSIGGSITQGFLSKTYDARGNLFYVMN